MGNDHSTIGSLCGRVTSLLRGRVLRCNFHYRDTKLVTETANKVTLTFVIGLNEALGILVDQKIREAMEQGELDDLEGKGKPLDTSENPFEDPELRLAHRMLRNTGFAPAWIEERKDIDSEFENARRRLPRAWRVLQNSLGTENERGAGALYRTASGSEPDQEARWAIVRQQMNLSLKSSS